MPNGMPMIVAKLAIAEVTWPIASHRPATRNHTTLPTNPSGPVPRSPRPVSSRRSTASWPNGKKQKLPNTKHARDHGIPMIEIAAISPASHQPSPMTRPPQTNQMMLPIVRMSHPPWLSTTVARRGEVVQRCSAGGPGSRDDLAEPAHAFDDRRRLLVRAVEAHVVALGVADEEPAAGDERDLARDRGREQRVGVEPRR